MFCSEGEASLISLKIQAVIIAKYFGISPLEVLKWPFSKINEISTLIKVIEKEGSKNGE